MGFIFVHLGTIEKTKQGGYKFSNKELFLLDIGVE